LSRGGSWRATRRLALEEDLADRSILVIDWGDTKDTKPHELVTLLIAFVASPVTHAVAVPASTYIAGLLGDSFKSVMVDSVKALFSKLVKQFKAKEIADFAITLSDGTKIVVDPNAQVSITLRDGRLSKFECDSPPTKPQP